MQHAAARQITLWLQLRAGAARLAVQDDGRGFRVPRARAAWGRHNHFGLLGLAERVDQVGGTLTVRSQPGAGTTVLVRLPRNAGEGAHEQDDPGAAG